MVYTELAQEIIDRMISTLRTTGDQPSSFQRALEDLTNGLDAERGLICQTTTGIVKITNQFTRDVDSPKIGQYPLSTGDSALAILAFLAQFPDASNTEAVILDAHASDNWATLRNAFKDFDTSLLVAFRPNDSFLGFLAIQSKNNREWSTKEIATVKKVADLMSIITERLFVIGKYKESLGHANTLLEIDRLFSEMKSPSTACVKAVDAIAALLGFRQSRVYLVDQHNGTLVDQLDENKVISLTDDQNPFVTAVKSGYRIVGENASWSYFGEGDAMLIRLTENQETLGVFGLWQLLPDSYLPLLVYAEEAESLGARISRSLTMAKFKSTHEPG
jgi:hypothetical protein